MSEELISDPHEWLYQLIHGSGPCTAQHEQIRNAFVRISAEPCQKTDSIFDDVLHMEFKQLVSDSYLSQPSFYSCALFGLLGESSCYPPHKAQIWYAQAKVRITTLNEAPECLRALMRCYCEVLSEIAPPFMEGELRRLLGNGQKDLRAIAVKGLLKIGSKDLAKVANSLVLRGNLEQRLGAASLIEAAAFPESLVTLIKALKKEKDGNVLAILHAAAKAEVYQPRSGSKHSIPIQDVAAFLSSQKGSFPLPKCSWLTLSRLPGVTDIYGNTLSETAVAFLIANQSKERAISASEAIVPLLGVIDRSSSASFAAALVEHFLNSEQAASDRWALTLGGLLGDNRIITLLLPRIQDWCDNSRHKLAEYAAQAISLLPGNEPLLVLDMLANRYRIKFKNIGKACAAAFNAAAEAQGITADELGDMVVPDCGFDAEGTRKFVWDTGAVWAELGTDLKLSWFDPQAEKKIKSLPIRTPDSIRDEVKTLTKSIREAVKAQSNRLEMALARQRRWPTSRWRDLYEQHPLLRCLSSSLIWGVYDASGSLLRTFRRYANGILADAGGKEEELHETDAMIGIVHPLELGSDVVKSWTEHLSRMKVTQPFEQVSRAVVLMDPLHGNRRIIRATEGTAMSAGTFRNRAEKRGWYRGSVVDGGAVSSYFKDFPGAGYEVILPTEGLHIISEPMDSIALGSAFFVRSGSTKRGSYIYDEPNPDDSRTLRFDQVSPVVFSETMRDLKAIIGTEE